MKFKFLEKHFNSLDIIKYEEELDNIIRKLDLIIKTYKELEELNEKHFLILSYLHHLKTKISDEEFEIEEYVDGNNLQLKDLKLSLNKLGEAIYEKDQILEVNGNFINKFLFTIVFDKENECLSTSYKAFGLKACIDGKIEYSGFNGRNWKKKFLG